MHRILFAMTTLFAFTAPAQQPAASPPAAGSNWQHVQALPVGTSIQVKAGKNHANCNLKSVDADTLTCTHGKDIVFQRSDILSIHLARRGRSTLVGTAIGGGAGAAIGVGVTASTNHGWFSGASWDVLGGAIVGTVGALIGAGIGAGTDFTHSTIYKAP